MSVQTLATLDENLLRYNTGTQEPAPAKRRVRTLDGLRGLAVLSVMAYHFCHVDLVSEVWFDRFIYSIGLMGWVGVDLFFVLSGFLITGILLDSKHSRRYFPTFYARRVLRIFPLYYAYLSLLLIGLAFVSHKLPAVKLQHLQSNSIWLFLYLTNIWEFLAGRSFGLGMSHLWSLAIEEQFYILWPIVVYFSWPKALWRLTICLAIGALAIRVSLVAGGWSPFSVYVFTFSRMDSLCIGALGAQLIRNSEGSILLSSTLRNRLIAIFCCAALLLLTTSGPKPLSPVVCTIGFSCLAICFGLVVLSVYFASEGSSSHSFLSNSTLVFFGKYSYGLYVLHVFVRAVLVRVAPEPFLLYGSQLIWQVMFMFVGFGTSVCMALGSWHLFEKYFLRLKRFFVY